jgi:elongation factor P
MSQYATNQFRKGLKIEFDKVPFEIIDFQHVSPGKGRAFTRTKVKNMLNGNVTEKTITSGDKVDAADTEQVEMQYLYKDPAGYNFMNQVTFDQSVIQEEILGDAVGFMQESMVIQVQYYNGRPIGVELPTFVILKIIETAPASKGDTVTGGTKPAKLEPGASVNVPFHCKEGDYIRVDTRDKAYMEKADKPS